MATDFDQWLLFGAVCAALAIREAELSRQREVIENIGEAYQAAQYAPGDHPVVPVKLDAFMKAVGRALQQKGEAG